MNYSQWTTVYSSLHISTYIFLWHSSVITKANCSSARPNNFKSITILHKSWGAHHVQIHLDPCPTSNRDHMRCINNTDDVAHLFSGWRMEGRACLFKYSLPSHTSCMLEGSCWSNSPCLYCRAELYHAFCRTSKFHLGNNKGFALPAQNWNTAPLFPYPNVLTCILHPLSLVSKLSLLKQLFFFPGTSSSLLSKQEPGPPSNHLQATWCQVF